MIAVPIALYLLCVALRTSIDAFQAIGMLLLFMPALLPYSGRKWVSVRYAGLRLDLKIPIICHSDNPDSLCTYLGSLNMLASEGKANLNTQAC